VPVKLWHDGDTVPDVRPMLERIRAALRDRVARWGDPAARAYGPVADRAQRPDVQVGTVNPDPDRARYDAMLHDPDRNWDRIGCAGGCGRELLFSGSYESVEWTCKTCSVAAVARPALRVIEGGRDL
jgi:hypothetical protein